MPFANQKGNVIAYVIIAMSTIAALAVGAFYMTSSAALGELGANNVNRAYFLALAGKEYALIHNLGDTAATYPSGRNFTMSNSDIFRLVISGNSITSTGIVNSGTPFEARRAISITKTGFSSRPDISFAKDMQSFQTPVQSQAGFIVPGTDQISLGMGKTGSFGAIWYRGSAVQGGCGIPPLTAGQCRFETGFHVYFVFQFAAGSAGDGFSFAFFNGNGVDANNVKNDVNSAGGDNGRGELMAYAGDSRIDAAGTSFLDGKGGRGIQPPKAAIEFDPYVNQCACSCPPTCFPTNIDLCSSCCTVCTSGSRCDSSRNHMAYVFWGDNSDSSCTSTIGRNTYDDNKHGAGAGSATEPQNARSRIDPAGYDATSYFDGSSLGWLSGWLLNTPTNIYAFRVEVTRADTKNSNNNYFYTVNSWIKQCAESDCSDVITSYPGYDNTKIAYAPLPADLPVLKRTIELNQTLHDYFTTFYFGWTAATGTTATQNVILSNFRMNFIKEPSGCGGYAVWNNLGSSGYFRINGAGCTAVANNAVIGNIGLSGSIDGFTNAACTISSSPSTITFTQAATADTNKNCEVYFNQTDK